MSETTAINIAQTCCTSCKLFQKAATEEGEMRQLLSRNKNYSV